jgi:hypothetical protein
VESWLTSQCKTRWSSRRELTSAVIVYKKSRCVAELTHPGSGQIDDAVTQVCLLTNGGY